MFQCVDSPAGIEIGQINLKGCDKRLDALCNEMRRRPTPWDIVAIVDPPPLLPWSRRLGSYEMWYSTMGEEIDEGHNPRRPSSRRFAKNEPVPKDWRIGGSAFLVSKKIVCDRWAVTLPEASSFDGNVATLTLTTTENDKIRLHNVYNRHVSIDLDQLAEQCMGSSDILLGDFNLTAEMWAGRKGNAMGNRLASLILNHDMVCLNERGKITYSRSRDTEQNSSIIDLIFVSNTFAHLVSHTEVLDGVEGFESDHRILSHRVEVGVRQQHSKRVNFKKFNTPRYQKAVRKHLEHAIPSLDTRPLHQPSDIDQYLTDLCGAMLAAVSEEQEHIVQSRLNAKIHEAVHEAYEKARQKVESVTPTSASALEARKLAAIQPDNVIAGVSKKLDKTRMRAYGRFLGARRNIFKLAKFAQSASKPRQLAHMPDLSNGTIKNPTGEDNARLMLDATFPDYSTARPEKPARPASAAASPQPPPPIHSPQELDPGEVGRIIKGLPTGKSALPDGLGYEAFKSSALVCVPYIEHLFSACLKLEYHPERFRFAVTLIVKKPGKKSYRAPGSWRPIALESCLGKVLERVMADRYNAIVLAYNLLPTTQFSGPGRSCSQALEYLLAVVYRAWCPGHYKTANIRFVSMLTLDMTGAFNRVPHAKLLEVLIKMGVPAWLVNMTASFLSCRSTQLMLQSYVSDEYYVNIGVPQGSPLSPILFALFTADLLQRLEVKPRIIKLMGGVEIFSFAFADDNHLIVISPSIEINCLVFETMHPVIMGWAVEHGASFSPSKYHVIHFVSPFGRKPEGFRNTDRRLRPNIEGLPEDVVKDCVRVLGVMVQYQLNWSEHVQYIVEKG